MQLTQNQQKSVERFQAIVRKKTISDRNGNIDREVFDSFLPMLKEIYPEVFAVVESQLINEYGILIRWKGKNSALAPVVLMAHYDVVSDKDQDWKHPAFAAEIHDGVVWGRGTIDNKCIFTGILEGMEKLIYIHPLQEEALLLDDDFKSIDKYPFAVVANSCHYRILCI